MEQSKSDNNTHLILTFPWSPISAKIRKFIEKCSPVLINNVILTKHLILWTTPSLKLSLKHYLMSLIIWPVGSVIRHWNRQHYSLHWTLIANALHKEKKSGKIK